MSRVRCKGYANDTWMTRDDRYHNGRMEMVRVCNSYCTTVKEQNYVTLQSEVLGLFRPEAF